MLRKNFNTSNYIFYLSASTCLRPVHVARFRYEIKTTYAAAKVRAVRLLGKFKFLSGELDLLLKFRTLLEASWTPLGTLLEKCLDNTVNN